MLSSLALAGSLDSPWKQVGSYVWIFIESIQSRVDGMACCGVWTIAAAVVLCQFASVLFVIWDKQESGQGGTLAWLCLLRLIPGLNLSLSCR